MTPRSLFLLLPALLGGLPPAPAAELVLSSPLDYQVSQRHTPAKGWLRVNGRLSAPPPAEAIVEVRLGDQAPWQQLNTTIKEQAFAGSLEAKAGGWQQLDVRVRAGSSVLASQSVAHVGIGEVFIIAGQSNSANYGAARQRPRSGLVAAFDGQAWRIADDPQPGAGGQGGSFQPAFADAVVAQEHVPVGLLACGIGATSVREWLPKGARFPQPPTIESRVRRLPDGTWESKGDAYANLVARMKSVGTRGFRAVLWHQGESDANQKDAARTLPGALYREHLTKVILQSRREIGWAAPWFVAQASYHVPGDEGSEDIRAAQASLWKDGVALEGPDSDALKGPLRERDGKGVHFSEAGLREHGARWAEKVLPWLTAQWQAPRALDGGTEFDRYESLPLAHNLGWVRAHTQGQGQPAWDGKLDEARWGTPSKAQVLERNWIMPLTDEGWHQLSNREAAGQDEVKFSLWVPDGVKTIRGVVAISGHGSGEALFQRADFRAVAKELGLAAFKFVGGPLQRGFWPRSLLFDHLRTFGEIAHHPELGNAPLFLYGHSNGTGFSAFFAAGAPERVWGWVSMRPGITFQTYQPAAAQVPGLVIFGEDDPFLARPSKAENLAVIPALRKQTGAGWCFAVEPKTGHGPGEKTWPLVYSFLRSSFAARVPAEADSLAGPVKLRPLVLARGHLGQNWDSAKGGYQDLAVAPYADFSGDKATASWLLDDAYARDWQAFQRDGQVRTKK